MKSSINLPIKATIFLLVLTCLNLANAQDSPCYDCHEDETLIEPSETKAFSWAFSWDDYSKGLHGDLDCEDCHVSSTSEGFEDFPHEIDYEATPTCFDCHGDKIEEIDGEFVKSVHATVGDGKFRCSYCHNPHVPPQLDIDLPRRDYVKFTNNICISCHLNEMRYQASSGTDKKLPSLYDSHSWLPRQQAHSSIVLCVCCHTPTDHSGVHEILAKSEAQRRCEACHYQQSVVATKFLGEPERTTWITNEVLFHDAYVKGAMRHRLVDAILLILTALAILVIIIHGILRWISNRRRDEKPFKVMSTLVYDKWVRSWHWINALFFLILMITGLRLHFGGRENPLLSFETSFHIHNLVGAAMTIWFIWFLIFGVFTGNAGSYWKKPVFSINGMIKQARYYLYGIFRGEEHPFHPDKKNRFNPLQKIAYLSVMYFLFPLLVITGVVLLYPEWLPEKIFDTNAGWLIATVHYLTSWAIIIIFVIHLYLITLGDRVSYLFMAMIDGLHRNHTKEKSEDDK